jgi:hypothetical protein
MRMLGRLSWSVAFALVIVGGCAVDDELTDSVGQAATGTLVSAIEAETMTTSSTKVAIVSDAAASGGKALLYWVAGSATKSVTLGSAANTIAIVARGDQCSGAPEAVVKVDGVQVMFKAVAATTWTEYTATGSFGAGAHTVEVSFSNDFYQSGVCDRNLRLDKVAFYQSSTTPTCTTCAAQGKNCGTISDGCGGTLTCGTCTSPQTCGGGGTANVCGTTTTTTDAGTTTDSGTTDSGTTTGDIVLAAIGDINPSGGFGATTNPGRTAQNIRNMNPLNVLGLGDFQYTQGTSSAIAGGFDKNFADLKPRILPTAGPTHDVASATDQLGYSTYWGRDAFKAYSTNMGNWHIISLPSAVYRYGVDTAGVLAWLQSDLDANTRPCTLAFWHEPYWSRSTSTHPVGSNSIMEPKVKPWMDALYAHGAELVLTGHQHNYQRFAPMRPDGTVDQANGLREFVVGSGGIGFYPFNSAGLNVESSNDNTYGVLKMTLKSNGYSWQFVPNTTGYTDSGSGTCH